MFICVKQDITWLLIVAPLTNLDTTHCNVSEMAPESVCQLSALIEPRVHHIQC